MKSNKFGHRFAGVLRLGACLLAAALATAVASAQPTGTPRLPPPAELFEQPAAAGAFSVSPSGERAAMILVAANGRRVAAVMGLADPKQHKVVGAFADADVFSVRWVNDKRLVFEARVPGARVREGDAGTFAVDHDGERPRQLIAWTIDTSRSGTRIDSRLLPYGWFLRGTVDDGSDDVLVYRLLKDGDGDNYVGQIARLDSVNGFLRPISTGAPSFARQWLADAKGELRVVRTVRDGRERLHWRMGQTDEWTVIEDRDSRSETPLVPRYLEGDTDLVVEGRVGRDTAALYTYDLKNRKLDPEPLAALTGFDLSPQLVVDARKRRLVGVHTRAARPLTVWFDERLAGIQKSVDAVLPPGRSNRLICARCASSTHFVIESRSDRESGEYYHYDHGSQKLRLLARARPWLPAASQGTRSFHRLAARDGLSLPVVVTHPPDKAAPEPLPAVLLVHGGPWLRGADTLWSAEAQFLATRGYRVLELEFRGSQGFGWRHFSAGWKQWGLAMQDDLADAVAWATKERLIDPARVCIVGASYGGYAALMGAVRHPDLYRCAVSHVGVTDLNLMYTAAWGNISEQSKRFDLPALLGDRVADAALLRTNSPVNRVAEIKIPVLLVHGELDRRVPIEHADRFTAAARAAGVPVERVDYFDEGHGFFNQHNAVDYLRRLERFLAKSLER